MRLILAVLFVPPLLAGASSAALDAARVRLRSAARDAGAGWPLKAPSLLLEKGARRLTLFEGGRAIRTFQVGLGAAPTEDKVREGDHRTPEGRYYVCSRNAASAFHLFLGVSYPDEAAAARGLRTHLITPGQARAIHEAQVRRGLPPQGTKLGGLVGVHGGGSGSDWTWGCIALTNEGIEELWVSCPLGTPIEIRK